MSETKKTEEQIEKLEELNTEIDKTIPKLKEASQDYIEVNRNSLYSSAMANAMTGASAVITVELLAMSSMGMDLDLNSYLAIGAGATAGFIYGCGQAMRDILNYNRISLGKKRGNLMNKIKEMGEEYRALMDAKEEYDAVILKDEIKEGM